MRLAQTWLRAASSIWRAWRTGATLACVCSSSFVSAACGEDEQLTLGGDAGAPFVGDASSSDARVARSFELRRVLPGPGAVAQTFTGCLFASPVLYRADAGARVVISDAGGAVTLIDAATLTPIWRLELPAPSGEIGFVVGTPVVIGQRLVVSYHTTSRENPASPSVVDPRRRHLVAVLDLERGAVDASFPVLELRAEVPANDGGTVTFLPSNALGRSALVRVPGADGDLGSVYVTFGNTADVQPWHGWAFELSLDAWRAHGTSSAITAVLVTTPEASCGPPGESGMRARICGGGLWAPSGPLLVPRGSAYDIILAPGNGQLDVGRRDFANTLMRLRPGLRFEPACDARACAAFDVDEPAAACSASCENLFIPRIPEAEAPLRPESGACDGMTMLECWGKLDYIGGSTPAFVPNAARKRLLVYPTKDGHAYLLDADHLGTQYDRHELVKVCGTPGDRCMMDWAGMSVTQPAVTQHDGIAVVLIPTFMPDTTHPAGVVALNVVEREGRPRFERRWEFPPFTSPAARTRFRIHPSRLALATVAEVELGIVVEAARPTQHGALLAIRTADGELAAETALIGPGYRFSLPLVHERRVFVGSCETDSGPGSLEVYAIDVR